MYEAKPRKLSYEANGFYCDEMNFMVASKNLQCGICSERFRPEDFSCLCACGHDFCKDCLKYYVLHKVRNQFALIECPKEGCKETIDKKCEMWNQLAGNLQHRYKRIEENIKCLQNTLEKLCPDCGTNLTQVKNQPNIFCTKCVKKFCKLCLSPPHAIHLSCERQVERFLKFNFQYRKCIQCKFLVEKSEGCQHMTCKCGYQFCYLCSGKWNGYNHQCPPKPKYIRPRSYHVRKKEVPVRQTFALNVKNLSFNPEQLMNIKPKGVKLIESNRIKVQKQLKKSRKSVQTSRNKQNQLFLENRSNLLMKN